MKLWPGLIAALAAWPALAQQGQLLPLDPAPQEAPPQAQQATAGTGAMLRGLDKVDGSTRDLDLSNGESGAFGRLTVTLGECRYPTGNPAGDAFAYLVIDDAMAEAPVFEGWMIASSPALNPLDHARYDIWVLRCKTE